MSIRVAGLGFARAQMEKIYDVTLSVAGRFDVTGIPPSYDMMVLELIVRSDQATTVDNVFMHANGDTTSTNYRRSIHYGGGSHSVASVDDPLIGHAVGTTGLADSPGFVTIVIPKYAETTFLKVAHSFGGYRHQAANQNAIQLWWTWENTAAINQITLQISTHDTNLMDIGSNLKIWLLR